jgi:hypothetical protein
MFITVEWVIIACDAEKVLRAFGPFLKSRVTLDVYRCALAFESILPYHPRDRRRNLRPTPHRRLNWLRIVDLGIAAQPQIDPGFSQDKAQE